MPKSKSKRKKSGKKRRSSGGGRPPPRKRDDKAALRGMVVGGLIFALLAFILMVPIGGATPFSHLLSAVGLTGEEAAEGPDIAPNAGSAAPQETVTEDEQKGLDDLIEKKKQ